ncbi:MAG TPA: glycosyltransferase family 1 protein [Noviherbaspirillum sp.]|uniref:glycosyltransferase family 4 protein n=1 Tax=Noviherbaspirillum sp. TaxID=1926288 RepID=UPI002B498055|nr:glycosyltransferase family 1 protein [Noviherbaspirillum sp.]HJV84300.1 glycosyltransferase family 1 protein [Noviherbaspirillum sp.]
MRIVIDLQGAQTENRFRGIGRYISSFVLALARNAGEHEIWLVLNAAFPDSIIDIRHAFRDLVPAARIRVFKAPFPTAEIDAANAWRARAAEIIREHFIQQLRPDVVLVSSLFEGLFDNAVASIGTFTSGASTAAILYDLIPHHNPSVYLPTPAHRQHYERKIASLQRAGLLLAISDYSRQDAIDALGLPPERVVSISAAIDARFGMQEYAQREAATLLARYGITRKAVMYAPGGFDPRKNFEGLIQAYALLPADLRAGHQLVIASKISDGDRARMAGLAEQAGLKGDELVLTGYVSDDDLVGLYNLATLFVFPSKHEGFGLPVLEAMACGAPTIGSGSTSIPEVIGWDEAMFDPASPRSIADKMQRMLGDDALRAELRKHGLQQAQQFSWDASARRALAAFEAWLPTLQEHAGTEAVSTDSASMLKAIAGIDATPQPSDQDLAAAADAIAFNTAGGSPLQLLLDISELVERDAKSGIQRVVRSILLELLKNAPDGYLVRPIYFDGSRYRQADAFTARFLGKAAPEDADPVAEFNQDDIYLGLDLHAHFTRALHPLHMQLKSLGVQVYFVVYDILLVQRPDWWHPGTSDVFEEWLCSIAQAGTGLVCISEAVAEDVRQWLRTNKPSRPDLPAVSSFHLGADVESSAPSKGLPENAADVLRALGTSPSFLMVGTLEPRKGHAQTLAAFELLWSRGTNANLVIVGKNGWLVDALVKKLRHHPELNRRLFWLEGISDEYLEQVYASSTCLIAASEGEGFGLPLIEAAQHRLPIIARDIPVFREVAGEHAFYFNGLEADALANAISAWLNLHAKGREPQSHDMPWLTWQQSAGQLLGRILPPPLPR